MTRREPDWADEAARGLDLWHEERDAIAAALRAERERCAGIAHREVVKADKLNRPRIARNARKIRSRIRAGDRP